MFKNENGKNNCHYRNCEAITDNLSRIKNKKGVMPILPAGKIQGIFELNKIIGRSLEKIFKKIFGSDIIYIKAAEILSSCFASPRMTEKWRCPRMTFSTLTLATILSTSIISESRADNETPSGTCGTNCNWTIEEDTLKITGNANGEIGTMDRYSNSLHNEPWWSYRNSISSVEISGVNNIGNAAFDGYSNLKNVYISPDVTNIGDCAFQGISASATLYIPDTVTNLRPGSSPSVIFGSGDFRNVVCLGNETSCTPLKNWAADYWAPWGNQNYSNRLNMANETQCTGGYYWNGASCNNKKNGIKCVKGFKQIEDFCNRIQYTPAEAAKVLKDEDNEITITFKK